MKRKILVIEDDADTRNALGIRLRGSGFDVAFAADGISAIGQALKERPDLVLLDLGLPAGDGFTVLERLRELGATAATPVIVVSARDAAVNRPRALAAGAVEYLEKPIQNAMLAQAIQAHLQKLPNRVSTEGSPRVLVIEDDPDTRRGLVMRLRASGFEASAAADAVTGMAAAVESEPDAILLDLGLPGGDGLVVLARLRAHTRLSVVPVIVLSARPEALNRQRALQAGATEYFQKPADNNALIAALRRATRRAGAEA